MEKISLNEFLKIKNRLLSLETKIEKKEEDLKTLEDQYFKLQQHILSYDLSDIPFEAWEGIQILSYADHWMDFSKTKANIDFSILGYLGFCNFKGCNVKNIENLQMFLKPDFFDEETIKKNEHLFLSDIFSKEFKEKFYQHQLTMDDLTSLSLMQISELKEKKVEQHFSFEKNYSRNFLLLIGIEKARKLYLLSKETFETLNIIFDHFQIYLLEKSDFKTNVQKVEVSEMKSFFFASLRDLIINSYMTLDIQNFPEMFLKENKDLFLIEKQIPEEVKERYYLKKLTLEDLSYLSEFPDLPVENFVEDGRFRTLSAALGYGNLQKALKINFNIIKHLINTNKVYDFCNFCDSISFKMLSKITFEQKFNQAIKEFFHMHNTLESSEELMNYDPSLFPLEENQRQVIELLTLPHIKQFEKETNFFFHKSSNMFDVFCKYYLNNFNQMPEENLSYDDFLELMDQCIEAMKASNVFTIVPNYDWMEGKFREDHPELFIDKNAPEELKGAFYKNQITPDLLRNHKEYIPYLFDKNLETTIKVKWNLTFSIEGQYTCYTNFIREYEKHYGKQKLLNLLVAYGDLLSDLSVSNEHQEIENEKAIEKNLQEAIYQKILKENVDYSYLETLDSFVKKYPDLFLNLDSFDFPEEEKLRLKKRFYERKLTFEDIWKHPELVSILAHKNLEIPFWNLYHIHSYDTPVNLKTNTTLFLKKLKKEEFLNLCACYGRYLTDVPNLSFEFKDNSQENFLLLKRKIESYIKKRSRSGEISYTLEDAPDFLKKECPDLFLEENAPEELKKYFYNKDERYPLNFVILHNHPEWMPYLKGKSISTALSRGLTIKNNMQKYFNLFGEETALKLGLTKANTVTKMIDDDQVDLMKKWYDKTGQTFLPDYVVMQTFPIDQADKFLASGRLWSKLMNIQSFCQTAEAREATLKLAYSFGVFDADQRGFKKLEELLTGLPKQISSSYEHVMNNVKNRIEENKESMQKFFKKEEGEKEIKSDLFSMFYKKQGDNYTLKINPQEYPKTCQYFRSFLEQFPDSPVLTPEKSHQLFGGFSFQYDPDFREFLLSNFNQILTHPEYTTYVSAMQKQFSMIKAINSNRKLTLDLSLAYVQENKFTSVDVGNEEVAEISAIAGYTQEDFDKLQEIYNYGKQRIFSSIPKIEKTKGKYTYEMLRLDDPLAMAIGTLTDCCQELGNAAELCMEHSMVDKHGRVFVVRDDQGNIAAQSWVWRNKNVICFDNIEIPDKAFVRAIKNDPVSGGKGFAKEIYDLYKQAAKDLIKEDEKVYHTLLEQGKITQEQYEGLKLGKVTVGLGYNDIASEIKKRSPVDNGILSHPLPFKEPVKLSRGLYQTDSNTQYILEETEKKQDYNGDTFALHQDPYIEYTDKNFTKKNFLTLEKLELETKGEIKNLNFYFENEQKPSVSEIADAYNFKPENTKIVMNPNFAIIYEESENQIKLGDFLFHTKIKKEKQQIDMKMQVEIQIRLALEQIANGKNVDITALNEKQKQMYEQVMKLTEEIDKERGLGRAR